MNKEYYNMLLGSVYYDSTDLRYNNQYKFFLSNQQLMDYQQFKNDLIEKHDKNIQVLDLKSFNSKYIYFVLGQCLRSLQVTYLKIVLSDLTDNQSTIIDRNFDEMLTARILSELDGSMQIENVPTTRTRLEQIKNGKEPENQNECVARNMIRAIEFILKRPEFNKENLHSLYMILSKDCLTQSQELNDRYYRDDVVYIDNYEGCPHEQIDKCMSSLFEFVKKHINNENNYIQDMLPHICHYYILYIHPYFDYNGRTARIVSLWISILIKQFSAPFFISEAINDDKKKYYNALRETRDMGNDLTYFLIYILNTSIRYSLIYRNLDYISQELLNKGILLTRKEKFYIKVILRGASDGYFDYKKFLTIANIDITKQAALKILNKLTEYGILYSTVNNKKVKLFNLNDKYIKYTNSKQTN